MLKPIGRIWLALWLGVVGGALSISVHAYPPAPGVTLKGHVRDEYGWLLREEGAEVVVRQGTTVIGRAPITNDVQFEFNYRVNLPVDSNATAEAYRLGALLPTSQYTVEVEVGGVIYTPIETLTGSLPVPEPGTVINLNLTLGNDTDSDGLPDSWELWQLQAGGFAPGDPNYNLEHLAASGDLDGDGLSNLEEYHAGTFALLNYSHFLLDPKSFHSVDLMEFRYYAVRSRSYRIEASTDPDLKDWVPVPAILDTPLGLEVQAWTSNRTGWLELYAPSLGPRTFYRLRVR